MKLTKRQKHIASCCNPLYNGFSTPKEVQRVKFLARRKYWKDTDWQEFCSFSPNGRREFFTYSWFEPAPNKLRKIWLKLAKKCARLHASGQCKESHELDYFCYDNADNYKMLSEHLEKCTEKTKIVHI